MMKRIQFNLAILLGLSLCVPALAQEQHGGVPTVGGPESVGAQVISKFEYDPIEWQVPKVGRDVERYEAKNGMVIFLMEDHRLPEFRINAIIRCGSVYDPASKVGISSLVGTVMRSGGTKSLTPDSLNSVLEYMAASIETGIGSESGDASLYCLSKDIETGVTLFADVLRNPGFDEAKLDVAKEQTRKSIKSRNDQPGPIVSREFQHRMYGDHPFGRVLEWETVKPLGREDLAAYHAQWFVPDQIMLGITGDFDSGRIKKLIEKHFGDWKASGNTVPPVPEVELTYHPGVYFVEKDISQANIRFGHLGIKQDNPDRFAISVMNFILGGGSFNSRMTSKVRSDEGLAYSVGSRYGTGSSEYGTFYAYCQTKLSTTLKAIDLMMAEVNRIRDGEVTDDELELAKDSYINRYVFQFTSADQIVGQLMNLEYDDRPRDLLETYLDNVRAVTKDDVLRVAQAYLHPDKISYIVVGKKAELDGDLASLGTVTEIELTDPVVD
jgi:zinc protease